MSRRITGEVERIAMDLVVDDELTPRWTMSTTLYTAISRHYCPSTLELHHMSLAVLAASFPA